MKFDFWRDSKRDEGRWGKHSRRRGWRVFFRKFFFPQLVDLASNTSTVVPDSEPLPSGYSWMRRVPSELFCVVPRKLRQDDLLMLEDVASVESTSTGSCSLSIDHYTTGDDVPSDIFDSDWDSIEWDNILCRNLQDPVCPNRNKSASEGDQTLRRHSSLLDLVYSMDVSRPTQYFGCPSMEFVYSLQECLRYVADNNLI